MSTLPQVPYPASCVNDLNVKIIERRYLTKDSDGSPLETPDEMFWRVALAVAEAERQYGADDATVLQWATEFYRLMSKGLFEPNTPTLMNAGKDNGLSYSACFVLPVSDSLVKGRDSIYRTLSDMAAIHQSGGGTGFSFSNLRPEGAIVNSTSGVASGPISFMSLYDASTEVVKQGGTRRGANMGILHVSHPDILKFISCKSDTSKITNFNISVAVTDKFIRAVLDNEDFDLVHPVTKATVATLKAREIFDAICKQAHATGEPGLFFIDEANRHNPVPHLGSYDATNPCGEQPLLPYDVCNLGSINIGAYSDSPATTLYHDIGVAIRFLDNVIDVNNYPLPEIKDLSSRIRRIGLGLMGWADYLIRLGIPYSSQTALDEASNMMAFIQNAAHDASARLAESRGVFPEWDLSVWGPDATCAKNPNGTRIRPERPLRNCNITTVAPTGTISIIAGCSGGIEPLFAVAFMRNQAGMRLLDVNKDFEEMAKSDGWYSKELFEKIASNGHIHYDEVPEWVQQLFITAHDVTPEHHIKMQAAFQKHCDSAISKTINLAREATVDDVERAYLTAFDLKCKGVTVYRDGARPDQVLSTGKTEAPKVQQVIVGPVHPVRPEYAFGFTRKIQFANLGKVYITINFDDDTHKPVELFLHLGKAGSDENSFAEALARMISLYLKEGGDAKQVINQLEEIGGRTFAFHNGKTYSSIPDAIGDTMRVAVGDTSKVSTEKPTLFGKVCPDCGASLNLSEGCNKCVVCGYSSCG